MQIVSWNTHWACGVDKMVDIAHAMQSIEAMGACDVLCLQAVAINYPKLTGSSQDQLQAWQAMLPEWSVFFGAAVDEWTAAGNQRFGNLIATRLPVLQVQHYPLPYPADAGLRSMQRICSVVTVQDPELGPVRVLNTHLEEHSVRQRMAQARYLRHMHFESLAQVYAQPRFAQDGTPFQSKAHTLHAVLCGDFNFCPQDGEYEALASKAGVIECLDEGWSEQLVGARWNDAWRVQAPKALQPATYQPFASAKPKSPMASDLVWVSDSLRMQVRSCAVGPASPQSDHQPVRVVIATEQP